MAKRTEDLKELRAALVPIHGKDEAASIVRLFREYLREHPHLTDRQVRLLSRRLMKGEPVQYVVEHVWFYRYNFYVDKHVLIPRPETEELVDWIVNDHKKGKAPLRIIDIGTGSGCISVTLAAELPSASVAGWDVSADAIKVARKNARQTGVKVEFGVSDFLRDGLRGTTEWDIVVSNPPYVTVEEMDIIEPTVRDFEPHVALTSGLSDGLFFYRRIAEEVVPVIENGGVVYVEMHADYAKEIKQIFRDQGFKVTIRKDINGLQRMLKAE